MTLNVDPNPLHWSTDVKTIGGVLIMILTITGSAWKAADYIGGNIYRFAEIQTRTLNQLEALQKQQVDFKVDLKTNLSDENTAREKSMSGLEQALVPRIETLEKAVNVAKSEASAAKARADDMKEDLRDLKGLASQNLAVSQSHTEAITATRNVVAPKNSQPH